MLKDDDDKLFIVLAGTEVGGFMFDMAFESQIADSKRLIKLIEIDFACTGYEILELCYGIEDIEMRCVGDTASITMPIKQINDPQKFINNKETILGHIKYCLEQGKEFLGNNKSNITKKALRKESILNFRVFRPISI